MTTQPFRPRRAAKELMERLRYRRVEAMADIIKAFEATEGNALRAARLLGIGHSTILRIMQDPGVAAEVKRIRDAVGPRDWAKEARARGRRRGQRPSVTP